MFCWRENFNVEEFNVGKIIVENFQRWKIYRRKKVSSKISALKKVNVEESQRWKKSTLKKVNVGIVVGHIFQHILKSNSHFFLEPEKK